MAKKNRGRFGSTSQRTLLSFSITSLPKKSNDVEDSTSLFPTNKISVLNVSILFVAGEVDPEDQMHSIAYAAHAPIEFPDPVTRKLMQGKSTVIHPKSDEEWIHSICEETKRWLKNYARKVVIIKRFINNFQRGVQA